jgi:hypothetical protein
MHTCAARAAVYAGWSTGSIRATGGSGWRQAPSGQYRLLRAWHMLPRQGVTVAEHKVRDRVASHLQAETVLMSPHAPCQRPTLNKPPRVPVNRPPSAATASSLTVVVLNLRLRECKGAWAVEPLRQQALASTALGNVSRDSAPNHTPAAGTN